MKKTFWGLLAVTILLTACNFRAGSEFEGKWVRVDKTNQTMDIERDGDKFIVKKTGPNGFGGMTTRNIPATLVGDALQMNIIFSTIDLVIDKSTGHLMADNGLGKYEYKQVKD